MKVIGVCGSPKKDRSTTLFALSKAMDIIKADNFDTEIIKLADYNISGCIDCGRCRNSLTCSIDDDFKKHIIAKLNDNELKGIIFASPVYFGGVSSQMKAFIDRSVMFRRNGFKFSNLVAGVITVGRSRNGGQELAAFDLIKNALIQDMIVVGDAEPTSHFGGIMWSGIENGIEYDESGLKTVENLGKKISHVIKKIYG